MEITPAYRDVVELIASKFDKGPIWTTRVLGGNASSIATLMDLMSTNKPGFPLSKRREVRERLLLTAPHELLEYVAARLCIINGTGDHAPYAEILYTDIEMAFHKVWWGKPVDAKGFDENTITRLTIIKMRAETYE